MGGRAGGQVGVGKWGWASGGWANGGWASGGGEVGVGKWACAASGSGQVGVGKWGWASGGGQVGVRGKWEWASGGGQVGGGGRGGGLTFRMENDETLPFSRRVPRVECRIPLSVLVSEFDDDDIRLLQQRARAYRVHLRADPVPIRPLLLHTEDDGSTVV